MWNSIHPCSEYRLTLVIFDMLTTVNRKVKNLQETNANNDNLRTQIQSSKWWKLVICWLHLTHAHWQLCKGFWQGATEFIGGWYLPVWWSAHLAHSQLQAAIAALLDSPIATTRAALIWTWHAISQAARQGLAVLMATAEVVLKHATSTTYQSHIYESIDLNLDRVITSRVSATLPSLVKIVSAVAPPHGGEIYGSRAFFIIIFVFIFFDTHTAYTREPILTLKRRGLTQGSGL